MKVRVDTKKPFQGIIHGPNRTEPGCFTTGNSGLKTYLNIDLTRPSGSEVLYKSKSFKRKNHELLICLFFRVAVVSSTIKELKREDWHWQSELIQPLSCLKIDFMLSHVGVQVSKIHAMRCQLSNLKWRYQVIPSEKLTLCSRAGDINSELKSWNMTVRNIGFLLGKRKLFSFNLQLNSTFKSRDALPLMKPTLLWL